MFPTETVDGLNTLLLSVAVLGVLTLVGVALRTTVGLLRRLFLPAALLGGAAGLALGPYGVGLFPESMVQTWSGMPGVLATVVFAPMLMGMRLPKLRATSGLVVPQLFFAYMAFCLLVGVPLVVSALLLAPLWGVNDMFGTLVEVGWPGGHGTAGAMTEVYEAQGWDAGGSLALTSATLGLVVGITVGMVLVNWGVRRGHTQARPGSGTASTGQATDVLPAPERRPVGLTTLNKDLVDTLAFHGTLIAVAVLIGWALQQLIRQVVPGMPLFPLAMIGGAVVQAVIGRTRLGDAVDIGCLRTIQGLALDLLVVSAVASIQLPVVVDNAAPLAVLMVLAAALALGYFFWAGPRLFQQDWFEQSITNFGTITGVSSVGLMLLRTADPELRTVAGKAYALRAPLVSPFIGGGLITAVLPVLTVTYGALTVGAACLAILVALAIAARLLGVWQQPAARRRASAAAAKQGG